jgi:hypothetical protein
MGITDLLLLAAQAAITFVIVLLGGSLLLGTFTKLRATLKGSSTAGIHVYGPLVELFKLSFKSAPAQVTTSRVSRLLVLSVWILTTVLALIVLPFGQFVPFLNLLGEFQIFGVLALLMAYPVGLMVLNFLSTRKSTIHNLKFLSEDFFSNFATYMLSIFAILLIYAAASTQFAHFPTLDEIASFQANTQVHIGSLAFPKLFGLVNPLAFVACFAAIPGMLQPLEYTEAPISRKWTPLSDFTGPSLGTVRALEGTRFIVLLVFFTDLFLGGAMFTSNIYLNLVILAGIVIFLAVLLSFVKTKHGTWVLDRRIGGFVRVHNLIAIGAIILSCIIVFA